MPDRDVTRPPSTGAKLTYDDFVLFPDDGKRHELIDGEHHVSPSPNLKHQAVVGNIYAALRTWLRSHPVGRVFVAPFDVVFSHVDVVEPDVLFVGRARQHEVLTAKHVRGAPDLVVEVGSPWSRRRDEQAKHRLYERFGVSEYWIVDPETDAVKVYRLAQGRYVVTHELTLDREDVLTTPLVPGFELPLVVVFEDSDVEE